MPRFNLDDYEPVEERLKRFWEVFPKGRVHTTLLSHDDKRVVVKAFLYRETDEHNPVSTGHAEEIVGSTPVNKTSAVENCETSAIGRALANANFASRSRASREEMDKVNRQQEASDEPAVARAKDALLSLCHDNKLDTSKVAAEFHRVTGESLRDSANLVRINKFATWLLNNTHAFQSEGDDDPEAAQG